MTLLTSGVCLDIGTGSAALSIELSKITDLEIIALDAESEAIELAKENCVMHGVPDGRIRFVSAPVEKMPLPDESADLILSRGSIPFWENHVSAFEEIQRVLAPGGKAMIGCGFSRYVKPLRRSRRCARSGPLTSLRNGPGGRRAAS